MTEGLDPVSRQLQVAIKALNDIKASATSSTTLWCVRRASSALKDIRLIDYELDVTPQMISAASVVLREDVDPSGQVTDDEVKRAICAALAAKGE